MCNKRVFYFGIFCSLTLIIAIALHAIYLPTLGEKRRLGRVYSQLEAHGFRLVNPSAYNALENTWLLNRFNYELNGYFGIEFTKNSEIPESFCRQIPELPGILTFTFDHADPGDHELEWAMKFPDLWTLIIRGKHHLSDQGFQTLRSKPELHLCLTDTSTLNKDLKELRTHTKLKYLHIHNSELDESTCLELEQFDSLKKIIFHRCSGVPKERLLQIGTNHSSGKQPGIMITE